MFERDLIAHGGWHTSVIEVRSEARDERKVLRKSWYRVREDFECEGKTLRDVLSKL